MIYVNVYDLDLKKIAILQNAYDIIEKQTINEVYSLQFTMPDTDEKNAYCQKFYYVRVNDDGQLYRIISAKSESKETGTITYTCEHVIAKLVDDVIFGTATWGNKGYKYGKLTKTSASIGYVLSYQTKYPYPWILGTCDFENEYQYSVENENLLTALFSIASQLESPYMWDYDTQHYPWLVSLKKIDSTKNPEYYLRAKKNILKSSLENSSEDLCTRLYCLGYGEGVNQLTIKDAVDNGAKYGKTYLQADDATIAKYGLITKIFADTRFKDATSLYQRGKVLLDAYSKETYTQTFDVCDLYEITNDEIDNAQVGKIAKLVEDGTITYITGTERKLDEAGNLKLTLSTAADDIASTIADLSERQRISEVYSQGATQIFSFTMNENADYNHAAEMAVYIPSDMLIVNEVKMCVTLSNYRIYHTGVANSDDTEYYTSEGGEVSVTTSSNAAKNAASGEDTEFSALGAYTINDKDKWFDTEKSSVTVSGESDGARLDGKQKNTGGVTVTSSAPTSDEIWSLASDNTPSSLTNSLVIHLTTKQVDTAYGTHTHECTSDKTTVAVGYNTTAKTGEEPTHNHVISVDEEGNVSRTWSDGKHDHTFTETSVSVSHNTVTNETGQEYHYENKKKVKGIHQHQYTLVTGAKAEHHYHVIKELPNHTHNFSNGGSSSGGSSGGTGSHTHQIDMSAHKHKFQLPSHSHDIQYGINEYSESATLAYILVDNSEVTDSDGNPIMLSLGESSTEIDLTSILLDSSNKIKRGWINIGIKPIAGSIIVKNPGTSAVYSCGYAYVRATVFVRGFISSLEGSAY